MDRISQLPDFIAHHILSCFDTSDGPPIDLVRMSVLSKTWFHLTASFPILDFTIYIFKSRESFFKYVEYTTSRFCNQNLTAHKLTLWANIRKSEELDIVNRCLILLLKNGVKELLISMPNYRLPNILLSVPVLKSLTIYSCKLPSSLMLDVVKLKSLIYLELESVRIDDEVIKYITSGCPLLQQFEISYCHGFIRFCVYGHQNLQTVGISDTAVEIIDIDAPNLSSLYVAGVDERGPPQLNLASCKKLASLSYEGNNLKRLTDFLSDFPVLKYLALCSFKDNNLKLSSHPLRALELNSEFDLEEIEFSTPNLGLFVYSDVGQYSCLGIRDLPHLKASMRCYPDGSIDALWLQKLRFFLSKKNGFKALNLYICLREKFIVLQKIKEIELPPYELEHIELHFVDNESSDHAAFVDAVLCCFRPRSLTLRSSFSLTNFEAFSLTDFEEQSALVKFTYKKLLEQENQGHTLIQIVSPYSSKAHSQFRGLMSLPEPLPREEKAISLIKEEGTHTS
ncbi:putative leucine-rich repeat domain superfamily, F-box-like domain superfamily [Helianthus annuus]|nr:putative leucine-rich repeat domain superfamily, F-box-like domain superfamily [Helianthus annuus]